MSPKTNVDIVFGAMTFGKEGEEQVRISSMDVTNAVLDKFQSYGHNEIDTARAYGNGTSEQYLAAAKWQDRGLVVSTKFYPNVWGILGRPKTHLTIEDMRHGIDESCAALGVESLDLWYLHGPDRTISAEEVLRACNELHKEGKFKRLGVSNFMSWEVAQLCEIAKANGWIQPSVYQGLYNPLHRTVEHELLPCLRKYGIAFYAFNPLAGGWLTGRYHRDNTDEQIEAGSRFDPKKYQGQQYRQRYWNDTNFTALEILRAALKDDERESESALRWMMHHSKLDKEHGDNVIIGASSVEQLEQNLQDFEKEPLNKEILAAFDQGWEKTRGNSIKYFH